MNPQNPRVARQSMERNGYGYALRESAERLRACKHLVEHAEITVVPARSKTKPASNAPTKGGQRRCRFFCSSRPGTRDHVRCSSLLLKGEGDLPHFNFSKFGGIPFSSTGSNFGLGGQCFDRE